MIKDKRVTAERIQAETGADVEKTIQQAADAINNSQIEAIIDQSEEPVRDAHAEHCKNANKPALSPLSIAMPPTRSAAADK